MHVIQLFFSFCERIDVEVIESSLPEGWARFKIGFAFGDFARYALLEFLDCGGWHFWLWFAHQQMDVVRHHYVSDQAEIHFAADEGKFLHESIARQDLIQKRESVIATESYEVQMT